MYKANRKKRENGKQKRKTIVVSLFCIEPNVGTSEARRPQMRGNVGENIQSWRWSSWCGGGGRGGETARGLGEIM